MMAKTLKFIFSLFIAVIFCISIFAIKTDKAYASIDCAQYNNYPYCYDYAPNAIGDCCLPKKGSDMPNCPSYCE